MSKKMTVMDIVQQEIMDELVEARLTAETEGATNIIRRSIDVDVMNGSSFRKYQAINKWRLSFDQETFYYTWKAVQDAGGSVKQGFEKLYRKVFAFIPSREEKDKKTGKMISKPPFWRYFRVYRWQDTEGIPYPELPEDKKNTRDESFEQFVDRVQAKHNISIVETGNGCSHDETQIRIAPISRFDSSELYYATLFREMVYMTGDAGRLNRDIPEFKEELTAEIASATLCQRFGINIIPDTIGDIDRCIKALSSDKKLFITACSKAKQALDYLDK